jgi:gluconokinase
MEQPTSRRAALVVVMGVSGVGKSVVGEALARRLSLPYVDADALHPPENVEKMRAGTPLTDVDRWPWLTRVGAVLQAHDEQGLVVSCSALRRAYRDVLVQAAPRSVFCHLVAEPALLQARLSARREHFMPASLLASQLATLEPLQPDEPGLSLPVVNLSVEQLAARLQTLLLTRDAP